MQCMNVERVDMGGIFNMSLIPFLTVQSIGMEQISRLKV